MNEAPHRGTSQGSGKLNPLTPFAWDDLMQEQRINSTHIDSEYTDTFNKLTETTIGELEHAKRTLKGNRHLSQRNRAKLEQEITIKAIQSKASEYEKKTQSAYSLYGHNPFFLMKELSFRKIFESMESSPPDVSIAYTAIDNTYRSALEMKRISMQMNIMAKQLEALTSKVAKIDKELQAANNIFQSSVDENISTINQEANIHFQLLPSFLLERITAIVDRAGDSNLSQSLTKYKLAINKIVASEQAAIGSYVMANPAINSPLSKPELEALKNLVDFQANTHLGRRWQDYHASLLHSETIRHLTDTTNAFSGLIARAQEAERLQEHINIAAAQKTHQRAQERKQSEARAAAKNAERIEKQKIASKATARFDEIYKSYHEYSTYDIDQMLFFVKDKQRELRSAHHQASLAEREIVFPGVMSYGTPHGSYRGQILQVTEKYIESLTQKKHHIENINISTISGADSSVRPLIITTDGLITGYDGSSTAMTEALGSLREVTATVLRGPVFAFFASIFYSPTLGNGELQRNPVVLTIPLSQLIKKEKYIPHGSKVSTDWLRYRVAASVHGGHTQLFLTPTTGMSAIVRARQAKLDPKTNLYTFTTEGLLPRTLTWTPNIAPGSDSLGSTELFPEQPEVRIYSGARVTQIEGRNDEHPTCDQADIDDYILEFPIESGIDPVYVMVSRSGPRYEPGTATGIGQAVGTNWLGNAREAGGSPIPVQIADQLRGQDFRSFDKFREAFWSAVAADTALREQFGKADLKLLLRGSAPTVDDGDNAGKKDKFEIHHQKSIKDGGAVYDIDNLTIMTPKAHIELHKNGNKKP